MGITDILTGLKNKVLDAATYELLRRNFELLEENNLQLKDKVEFQKEEIAKLKAENLSLAEKLGELHAELDMQHVEDEFVIHKGFAFKQNPDGKYEPTGYCPTCKVVMSKTSLRTYQCPKCKYLISRCELIPEALARQLNSEDH